MTGETNMAGASPAGRFGYGTDAESSRRRGLGAARTESRWLWPELRQPWREAAIATLGALAAAGVAYTTSRNPAAAPPNIAAAFRAAMIVVLIGGGLYAQTSRLHTRMGGLLLGAGFFSALWLLNGSGNPVLFTAGLFCVGLAPTVFAYLLLAYPTGHIRSSRERRFLLLAGGGLAGLWAAALLLVSHPAMTTPLIACGSHCPRNVLSLGILESGGPAVRAAIILASLVVSYGTVALLFARVRSASALLRTSLGPICLLAAASAAVFTAYRISDAAGARSASALGTAWVSLAVALPFAILFGLGRERQTIAQALADFVSELAGRPERDPEALMARILQDPSLTIAYRRPGRNLYIDAAGMPVDPARGERAVTWISRDRTPIAAVMYDPELVGEERYVHAAGAAAVMQLEKTRLEADLKASTADLAASRARLVETADAERRRLERDLHDSVQQHLVALRLNLELATERLREDPQAGERALAAIGDQMDDVLQELRALARGIYPALLRSQGVAEALRSAVRSSPIPVAVRAVGIGRYAEETEVAVYFCCLEAVQNAIKHAGGDAAVTVTLWKADGDLGFDVRDSGCGYDPETLSSGHGQINMRDRIAAVGGIVSFTSTPGRGTSVRGVVPAVAAGESEVL